MRAKSSNLEIRLLKSAIRDCGLGVEAIAQKAGITLRTAEMVLRGFLFSPRMLRRFESALGRAIWTAEEVFLRQQALGAWLGFDPFILNLKRTRTLASAKGIPIGGMNPNRALVIALLFAAYDAAHPAIPPRPKRRGQKISAASIPPTGKAKPQT